MLLVQSVSGGQTEQETPRQTELSTQRQVQTRSETPQTAPTPAKPGQTDPDPDSPAPTKRTPKRNAKRRLGNVVRFVRAKGGKVTASQRSMARQLGVSATRVNELLRELQATGRIELYTLRSGTTVPAHRPALARVVGRALGSQFGGCAAVPLPWLRGVVAMQVWTRI